MLGTLNGGLEARGVKLDSDQISADLENLGRINRLSSLAGGAIGARQIQTMLIAPSVSEVRTRDQLRQCPWISNARVSSRILGICPTYYRSTRNRTARRSVAQRTPSEE